MKYIAFVIIDNFSLNSAHYPDHIYGSHSGKIYNNAMDAIKDAYSDVVAIYGKHVTICSRYGLKDSYCNILKYHTRQIRIYCIEVSE